MYKSLPHRKPVPLCTNLPSQGAGTSMYKSLSHRTPVKSGLGATIALVTNDITCPSLLNSGNTEHFCNSVELEIHRTFLQLFWSQNSLNILVTLLISKFTEHFGNSSVSKFTEHFGNSTDLKIRWTILQLYWSQNSLNIGVCVTLLKGVSRLPQQKGGKWKGGSGVNSPSCWPFRADPTLSPTWRIYNIVTLRLKYTKIAMTSRTLFDDNSIQTNADLQKKIIPTNKPVYRILVGKNVVV